MIETLPEILDKIVSIEGGYSDNPNDSGGETIWGITKRTALSNGYSGNMIDMTRDDAKKIYMREYIQKPNFDKVHQINMAIGYELIDTGINCGQGVAATFLQRSLNAFNNRGKYYNDVYVDGKIGEITLKALRKFLINRHKNGETALLRCMNSLQGEHYVRLAERREKDEEFIYGWFMNRIVI